MNEVTLLEEVSVVMSVVMNASCIAVLEGQFLHGT
jgi:hypothetical protein